MGKALIITEKPSVSRDIVEAIGGFTEKDGGEYWESDNYVCTYAVGHIFSLLAPEDIDPIYKRWRLADLPIIPEDFAIKPLDRQKGRIKVIQKLIKRADVDSLINACDAAREGELIFREIVKYSKTSKPHQRLWLQSMTKAAICKGFEALKPGENYNGLGAAAECRAFSDWLIGMNATRAFTVRLKSRSQRGASWSAGRVQTPTLALLVDRELEILTHVPVPYCRVHAEFDVGNHQYEGSWYNPSFKRDELKPDHREDRIFDKEVAESVLKDVEGQSGDASETRKPKSRKPPQLFDLTTAQKEANRRFGWSAKRTLGAAQRCYEAHKVLTYPRTSSRVLPEDYRDEVDRLISVFSDATHYGPHAALLKKQGLKNTDKIFNDAGVGDHFAIIPTGEIKKLEGDDKRFFDLVTRTFLAAFYPPAIYEEVERTTVVAGHYFRSKPPPILKEPGWQAVFEKETEAARMPPLKEGEREASGVPVKNKTITKEDVETKPPGRIGEAGLLSLMENAGRQVEDEELSQALRAAEGLGTAATRADIIENLKAKEYVDRNLRPSVKGIRLIDILHRINASRLTSAELTAQLELHLNEVEDGKRSAKKFLDEVITYTKEIVDAAKDFDYETIYPDDESLGICPQSGEPVYERAWFYGSKEATKPADEPKTCDFLIWKDLYGRYIDRQTVKTLLANGRTGELDGFRTQSGQTYKAVLAIEDGQVVRIPVEGSQQDDDGIGFEVNPEPLGACPTCKEDCVVVETPREYICKKKKAERDDGNRNAKGFSFPRLLCKREMSREEVSEFIKKGETTFLTNFISKKGRPFAAKLKATSTGGFSFEFPERGSKKKTEEKSEDANGAEKETKVSATSTKKKKVAKKAKKVTKKANASELRQSE